MEYGRKFFGMEWNMEENFSMEWNIWNGRFLWNGNGMEENCQYGIWKNRLPFHSILSRIKKLIVKSLKGFLAKTTYREVN